MRVTNKMMSDRVVFNLQRSMRRFLHLQTNMSTGRRINAPSDDPVGTVRDLNYRTELNELAQWQKNIDQARNWTSNYDSVLGDMKDMISTAREIAVAMADGTYDANARIASASEIRSIIGQLLQVGNSELEGRRIFGGNITQRKPLAESAAGVSYYGDNGAIEFETEPGGRTTVNFSGQTVYLRQLQILGEAADLNVGLNNNTLLADLHSGTGIDLTPGTFVISDKNSGTAATIDISAGAPTTLGQVITSVNNQLAAAGLTSVTLEINSSRNGLAFSTTQTGEVSGATLLSDLHDGSGIDLQPGLIRIFDGAATDLTVDLSGSVSLQDVIDKFNAQVAAQGIAGVTMAINAAGTGLQIADTNGPPLGLSVADISGIDQTAGGLGILGSIAPQLVGTDLDPAVRVAVSETTGTTAMDLGILAEFTTAHHGADLDARLTAASTLADLNSGLGMTTGEFKLIQGDAVMVINLADPTLTTIQDLLNRINASGLNVTASINSGGCGIQVANNDSTRSFVIEELGAGQAAKDFQLYGSSDLMGTINLLARALEADDQAGTGLLIGGLDKSIEHLLTTRATAGARGIRLDTTARRLVDQELEFTRLLAEVEDLDLPTAVTELSTYENSYQAALLASSRIIQPSLLNFLK